MSSTLRAMGPIWVIISAAALRASGWLGLTSGMRPGPLRKP